MRSHRRWLSPLLLVALLTPAPAAAVEMALTFDDLPAQRAGRLAPERVVEIMERLTAVLGERGAPATGFVNEEKLEGADGEADPRLVGLLGAWLDAGLELGNHTHSHPDLHRVAPEVFEADLLRGERIIRALTAERGLPLRYFRHPFLHTGRTPEVRDRIHGLLERHGYRVAPVTVDNSEWIFARAYDEAIDRGDPGLARRLADAYLDYMDATCRHYERQATELLGRPLPQVLLLHANTLNARHLDELLARLAGRGVRFLPLARALEDPAYRTPDEYFGPAGISWLHRWALTRGVPKSFFAGEPATPGWVQELAGVEE
ncbi:MAG: polysaccharide deacetylase family protein [Thermoanaerobaculia bacterium]|nr:polysaccharide deacetylase family protein [Thermoanaerobaculia bacterium]